jgi:hypothetical protein
MGRSEATRARVMRLVVVAVMLVSVRVHAQTPSPQNPSPMAETTRAHERLTERVLDGTTVMVQTSLARPVSVHVPSRVGNSFDLVIHFHGAAWLVHQSTSQVSAAVQLGAGSGVYDRAFRDTTVFDSLLASITNAVREARGRDVRLRRVTLSGFSAGHGAIRSILRSNRQMARVDAVLLVDGLHTSYVPEGRVLADSGSLDTTNLVALTDFARAAARGEKRMLITHSEIFPGTFASTTECANWMLASLGVPRRAVLRWGPRGMQQLSAASRGRFALRGYAGNSAPDHVDQLHALPELLRDLER